MLRNEPSNQVAEGSPPLNKPSQNRQPRASQSKELNPREMSYIPDDIPRQPVERKTA
jgi:hypothetical protein